MKLVSTMMLAHVVGLAAAGSLRGQTRAMGPMARNEEHMATLTFPNMATINKVKENGYAFDRSVDFLDAVIEPGFEGAATSQIKVMAGQDFLNTAKSQEYHDNKSTIKQTGVITLNPPPVNWKGWTENGGTHEKKTVWAIADGHHRIVWNGFHHIATPVMLKNINGLASAQPMNNRKVTAPTHPGPQQPYARCTL